MSDLHFKKVTVSLVLFVILFGTMFVGDRVMAEKNSIFSMLASVFFVPSVTSAGLQAKFATATSTGNPIRILIMPGHEPNFGGTEYRGLTERDMAVDLANDLAGYLRDNPHYTVTVARDKNNWNPEIESYFETHWGDIATFAASKKAEMAMLEAAGQVSAVTGGIPHNSAPSDVALRLFGINKWANDNHMDIAIHIHLNDYYPRRQNTPGGVQWLHYLCARQAVLKCGGFA